MAMARYIRLRAAAPPKPLRDLFPLQALSPERPRGGDAVPRLRRWPGAGALDVAAPSVDGTHLFFPTRLFRAPDHSLFRLLIGHTPFLRVLLDHETVHPVRQAGWHLYAIAILVSHSITSRRKRTIR